MNASLRSDLKTSFRIVWIIISVTILSVLTLSFLFPELLIKISPVCVSKSVYGVECFMCGMTRAFVEISSFNFSEAFEMNKLSLILFSVFFINSITFTSYIIKSISIRLTRKSKH